MARKVVVNRCYGGFRLSWKAWQFIAERKGLVASWFSSHGKAVGPDDLFTNHVIGPRAVTDFPKDLDGFITYCGDIPRDDPDLVAAVETLGEEASGALAKLHVTEIPDDVQWQIEEYDGQEWVSEIHRTW